MTSNLSKFGVLPNPVLLPISAFFLLTGKAFSPEWRPAKLEHGLPQPIRFGSKCTPVGIGDIRRLMELCS
jgi:hypothetical protein